MKIIILGSGGCDKCKTLTENAKKAVNLLMIEAEVSKEVDMHKMLKLGIMVPPALIIDEKVVATGRVLSSIEIAKIINPDFSVEQTVSAECGCGCSSGKISSWQKFIKMFLLTFIIASIVSVVVRENKKSEIKSSAIAEVSAKDIVVYYFHNNKRCFTCNKIEKQTQEFVENLNKSGENVKFISVNLDEVFNKHFISEFGLQFGSVVIKKGDKFENLDKVWSLVKKENAEFMQYLQNGFEKVVGEK